MGAFAGSAALFCKERRSDLSVVTLTMNNGCNLRCGHCYLQFAEDDGLVSFDVVEAVGASSAQTVAVVGMEPLRNPASAAHLERIVDILKARDKTVGIVTNGLNAHLLSSRTARALDWIDVSVDGDRKNYQAMRGAPVAKLERGIATLKALGARQINMLATVHHDKLTSLPGLVEVAAELTNGHLILSPFSATRHEGVQPRDLQIGPSAFLDALRACGDLGNCWVVLDLDWVPAGIREAFAESVEAELGGRTVLFRADPAEYGMVRITYDARLLTPRQAMHTSDYRSRAVSLSPADLLNRLAAPLTLESFG